MSKIIKFCKRPPEKDEEIENILGCSECDCETWEIVVDSSEHWDHLICLRCPECGAEYNMNEDEEGQK